MINLLDTITLARTKLHTRKARTAVTVVVSGLLFGLLLAILIVSSGILNSIEEFGKEGVGEKYIVSTELAPTAGNMDKLYDLQEDQTFIARVEQLHKERTDAKKAEATRLGVEYDPALEDPTPVIFSSDRNKRVISTDLYDSPAITQALDEITEDKEPFNIQNYTQGLDVKRQLIELPVETKDATLTPMKEDQEEAIVSFDRPETQRTEYSAYDYYAEYQSMSVQDDTLSMPYASIDFDAANATAIPIIVSFAYAEKALGLDQLAYDATADQKIAHIREVREKATKLRINFCYRNNESTALLTKALEQQKEIAKNKDIAGYVQPEVIYQVPETSSCGPVLVTQDTRSNETRLQDERLKEFAKKFENTQDPVEAKLQFQVIGISPSMPAENSQSIADGITSMLAPTSPSQWQIPAGYFTQLPQQLKPEVVFGAAATSNNLLELKADNLAITEFNTLVAAKSYLNSPTCDGCDEVYVAPYANNTLIMDEIRYYVNALILWIMIAISFVAIIILGSMIGRTVADGRRETAVFRAIGARRRDIVMIYSCYTLLLSLRVILFVALLGVLLSLAINFWLSPQITPEALISFSAQNLDKQFILFGTDSPYIIYLPLIIVIISAVAMIPAILLGIRRNPISDMRQE